MGEAGLGLTVAATAPAETSTLFSSDRAPECADTTAPTYGKSRRCQFPRNPGAGMWHLDFALALSCFLLAVVSEEKPRAHSPR
eukprot:5068769-Alexandrium_andersonii.AAC.1